jgi:pyridoxine 4-dehydrogenase
MTNSLFSRTALALILVSLMASPSANAFAPASKQQPPSSSSLSAYVDTSADSITGLSPPRVKASYKPLKSPFASRLDQASLGTLKIPAVGVGTISWSADKASDKKELEKLVYQATQHPNGLLLDTAERYGSNLKTALGLGWGETEKLTRKLLLDQSSSSSLHNNKPILASKFTPSPWRTTAESVVEACQDSRQRLLGSSGGSAEEPLDLYQLHMPDIVQPLTKLFGQKAERKDEIYWDGLAECYHRGLVKNVGVCNYGPTLLMQCQEHLAKQGVPLASNQIGYSILGRHNGAQATLDKGKELGIQTLAFFPFAMGLLTGKYNQVSTKSELGSSSSSSLKTSKRSRLESNDLYRYALGDGDTIPKGGITQLLGVMEDCANRHDKTLAQVALNYIICQGAVPIPGARTEEQYLDNMGAMGWRLTPLELSRIEEESEKLGFGFEGAGFKRTSEKFVGYGVEKWTLD